MSKTYEALSIFRDGVFNEIFDLVSDDILQDQLIEAIKEVEQTVIETYGLKAEE